VSLADRLVEQVRDAAERRTPLAIRGGGSKAFYGRPVAGEALDVSGHTGAVSYKPTELVVTARAGTSLAEIQALLAELGLLGVAARRADEAVRKVAGEQVGDARLIVREDPLGVRHRSA